MREDRIIGIRGGGGDEIFLFPGLNPAETFRVFDAES